MPRPETTVSEEEAGSGEEDELAGSDENGEYEIEKIIKHKVEGGKKQYWVKWRNFDNTDNSWVHESDAEGARELIDEYNRNIESQKSGKRTLSKASRVSKSQEPGESISVKQSTSSVASKGRGAKKSPPQTEPIDVDMEDDEEDAPKTAPVSKTTKRTAGTKRKQPDSEMADRNDYKDMHDMKKHMHKRTWEDIVDKVDTVEANGDELRVFFVLHDGTKGWNNGQVCREKCPNKLLDFYESHLKWKPT